MRAMNREMTLVEWISLHCLGMADYVFWAERYFCKPSKRTILQAQKVFDKLEARWDEQMEKDLGERKCLSKSQLCSLDSCPYALICTWVRPSH